MSERRGGLILGALLKMKVKTKRGCPTGPQPIGPRKLSNYTYGFAAFTSSAQNVPAFAVSFLNLTERLSTVLRANGTSV